VNAAVLVTGASGFIGRWVVRLLSERQVATVALTRSASIESPGVVSINGDLLDPDALDRAMKGVDRVVHLAAATGKASLAEMERVNVGGTRTLVEACVRNGVRRIVHVSSIAVTYSDLSDYPYGRSKLSAEQVVKESDLDWTIVRPTVVLGPDSPALGPFRSLAAGPALMVPGGGRVKVQPIDVRDVARSLVDFVTGPAAVGEIVELGGPEQLPMRELLGRVRKQAGKGVGPMVPIPLGLLRGVARVAEMALGTRAPVTPGQLTAFRFDSTAREAPDGSVATPEHDVAAMLDVP
jgi:nucleoside-diphosphate-sugar epimerase